METKPLNNLDVTAIKSVTYYIAPGPVECCDRCSSGIRHVYVVRYKDGFSQKFGSECINRVLDAQPTLRTLFHKNAKRLKQYLEYMAIFSGPVESMPRGREYFGSGLFFIGTPKDKDIFFNGCWYFHPAIDIEKNANHMRKVVPAEFAARCMKDIEVAKPKLVAEIARLEDFLARIIRKVGGIPADK